MNEQRHTPEPFGYFKAEPFGWSDCTETDEGAQPLYDQAAIDEIKAELEKERMRLAACGVVAISDTPESTNEARHMHPDYQSASCDDVARRVDECMELRKQRDMLLAALEQIANESTRNLGSARIIARAALTRVKGLMRESTCRRNPERNRAERGRGHVSTAGPDGAPAQRPLPPHVSHAGDP